MFEDFGDTEASVGRTPASHSANPPTSAPFAGVLPFPVSPPRHPTDTHWDRLLNKPLARSWFQESSVPRTETGLGQNFYT